MGGFVSFSPCMNSVKFLPAGINAHGPRANAVAVHAATPWGSQTPYDFGFRVLAGAWRVFWSVAVKVFWENEGLLMAEIPNNHLGCMKP